MINFTDWLLSQESSAFTRSRTAAALGTGPSIPNAEINSRSTASPWEAKKIRKRNKKGKKKVKKSPNKDVDKWVTEVADLKKEIDELIAVLEKKKIKEGATGNQALPAYQYAIDEIVIDAMAYKEYYLAKIVLYRGWALVDAKTELKDVKDFDEVVKNLNPTDGLILVSPEGKILRSYNIAYTQKEKPIAESADGNSIYSNYDAKLEELADKAKDINLYIVAKLGSNWTRTASSLEEALDLFYSHAKKNPFSVMALISPEGKVLRTQLATRSQQEKPLGEAAEGNEIPNRYDVTLQKIIDMAAALNRYIIAEIFSSSHSIIRVHIDEIDAKNSFNRYSDLLATPIVLVSPQGKILACQNMTDSQKEKF